MGSIPESERSPGEGNGRGSLAGCSPRGCERLGHDLAIKQQQHGKYQGVRWLGCMVSVCLVLEETTKLSSKVAVSFYIPTGNN